MGNTTSTPTEEEALNLKTNENEAIHRAAKAIQEADIFLLSTGAGFSADSGLAVYKDIANVPAYNKMGVDYMDLCTPEWIESDPDIFYGFWGMCFNDYRDTQPHEGYYIIRKWKQKHFSVEKGTASCQLNTDPCNDHEDIGVEEAGSSEQPFETLNEWGTTPLRSVWEREHDVRTTQDPFFVYTSNVDSHAHAAGYDVGEVEEIHGSVNDWQCSAPDECNGGSFVWRAPEDFRFEIDEETMRCAKDHQPVCRFCGRPARPNILFFGDFKWYSAPCADGRHRTWRSEVATVLDQDETKKMVIVEIGAGIRVPTIRYDSEAWLDEHPNQVTLIRINPDFPLVGKPREPKAQYVNDAQAGPGTTTNTTTATAALMGAAFGSGTIGSVVEPEASGEGEGGDPPVETAESVARRAAYAARVESGDYKVELMMKGLEAIKKIDAVLTLLDPGAALNDSTVAGASPGDITLDEVEHALGDLGLTASGGGGTGGDAGGGDTGEAAGGGDGEAAT